MKRRIIEFVRRFVPYRLLPKGLKKIVIRLVHTTSPVQGTALVGSDHVLNGLIAYNKMGGYCTPISSQQRPVVQQILKGRVHEADTIEFIRSNCGKGDVVHAGTFFGDFLPGISSGLSPGAKVWAFEPNKENFRCASITVILNGLTNVILKNAGLGESKSVQKLLVRTPDGTNLGGTSRIVSSEEGTTYSIDIVSIDQEIPSDRHITVIQLDVEGYEESVLKGAMETIRRWKPALILEVESFDYTISDWMNENILSMGYHVSQMVHQNIVLEYKGTN